MNTEKTWREEEVYRLKDKVDTLKSRIKELEEQNKILRDMLDEKPAIDYKYGLSKPTYTNTRSGGQENEHNSNNGTTAH